MANIAGRLEARLLLRRLFNNQDTKRVLSCIAGVSGRWKGDKVTPSECCFPMSPGSVCLMEDNSCNFIVHPWGQETMVGELPQLNEVWKVKLGFY